MKIIDLLIKKSNGEKLPKKIIFQDMEFIYNKDSGLYLNKDYEMLGDCFNLELCLDDEVIIKAEPLKNKEVSDALHMLLHCSLKDKECETQVGQFHIVYNYIQELENKLKEE